MQPLSDSAEATESVAVLHTTELTQARNATHDVLLPPQFSLPRWDTLLDTTPYLVASVAAVVRAREYLLARAGVRVLLSRRFLDLGTTDTSLLEVLRALANDGTTFRAVCPDDAATRDTSDGATLHFRITGAVQLADLTAVQEALFRDEEAVIVETDSMTIVVSGWETRDDVIWLRGVDNEGRDQLLAGLHGTAWMMIL